MCSAYFSRKVFELTLLEEAHVSARQKRRGRWAMPMHRMISISGRLAMETSFVASETASLIWLKDLLRASGQIKDI